MEKKLYRGALIFFTAMLLLSILWPYEQKLQHWDLEPSYLVKESDEIFFNNTRIHQYRTEERAELAQQGFRVHRNLNCTYDTTQPLLNFAIINSWRTDQAYIIAEPNTRSYFSNIVYIALGDSVATLSPIIWTSQTTIDSPPGYFRIHWNTVEHSLYKEQIPSYSMVPKGMKRPIRPS